MSDTAETLVLNGCRIYPGLIAPDAQSRMVSALQEIARAAPPFSPETRFGRPMSVRMTSAGRYGWFSDRRGYRYIDRHPNGAAWPPIPGCILSVWRQLSGADRDPDCCLINHYSEGARMGLHQDRDEADFSWPVVSVSLGDDGLFRIGGTERGGKTRSYWLKSGDALVLGGESRLSYHGIDRIRAGTSRLLPKGGRLNVTLRVVD